MDNCNEKAGFLLEARFGYIKQPFTDPALCSFGYSWAFATSRYGCGSYTRGQPLRTVFAVTLFILCHLADFVRGYPTSTADSSANHSRNQ